MKLLGIETATSVCSAAVVIDNERRYERNLDTPQIHSQKLVTLIDEVLNISGESIRSIDGIAISIGPGSFTGLRIGLSVAKGLAYGSEKPLVAVSTLEALALGAMSVRNIEDQLILPVLESRRDELFSAIYRINGGTLTEILPPKDMRYRELADVCEMYSEFVVTGNGAGKFVDFCNKESQARFQLNVLPELQRRCNAIHIASLGNSLLHQNIIADLASIEPAYLKEFYTLSQPN
ncbi:MAG: tRNA (adenosine(37)-N6)-threonylcarbamoyltransferase complex dimerization subunit type 1 TsaB [Bacteroidota bacterium]